MPSNQSSKPLSAWGLLLRQARELHGVTATEIASRLGVSKAHVGQSEFATKGARPLPRKWWGELLRLLPSLTRESLERAAATDSGEIVLPFSELTHGQQETAIFFAAALPSLTHEEGFRLRQFLKERTSTNGKTAEAG